MAVNIVANRAAGLKEVGKNQLVQAKAEAAIAQIETDITQMQTDLVALPAADNATTKLILGRAIQVLIRTNQRQKREIQYLAGG